MKTIKWSAVVIALSLCFVACGQTTSQSKKTASKTNSTENHHPKNQQTMDYSKISNETVAKTLKAWQNGEKETFLSYFVANPEMTDDGNPRDFQKFVEEACGHEKFLEIDTVKDDGKSIYGKFEAGQWGTFRVYFKFHLNADGKFDRLDIGQTNK